MLLSNLTFQRLSASKTTTAYLSELHLKVMYLKSHLCILLTLKIQREVLKLVVIKCMNSQCQSKSEAHYHIEDRIASLKWIAELHFFPTIHPHNIISLA